MHRTRLGYIALEGINSFATTIYFYYLPFIMKEHYGFSDRDNLLVTAMHGAIYIFASWQGGRLSERWGPFRALRVGYFGMALALVFGLCVPQVVGQIVAIAAWTVPLCLIWPTLEAMVSRATTVKETARLVGLYNLVWAGTNALAFNCGGWLLQTLAVGGLDHRQVLYGVTLVFMVFQFLLTVWLERRHRGEPMPCVAEAALAPHSPEAAAFQQAVSPKRFLQMAWVANPFAYMALNSLGALLPRLAGRFELTTAEAGMIFSLWLYARAASFVLLWQWTGWHYRFRWLALAFAGLAGSFLAMLFVPYLWMVIVAQGIFGFAVGLMYYSSLFYSVDVGDTKTEHSGLHEAAIGLGTFAGPLLGATTITLLPQQPGGGALAITGLLLTGLGPLVWLRLRKSK